MFYNVFFYLALGFNSRPSFASVHKAPIIIPASKIEEISRYPIKFYRVFATDEKGNARQIPFQIDEVNDNGDFILPNGSKSNESTSNGLFDRKDELSFMGDDVGALSRPKKFFVKKPNIIYELTLETDKKNLYRNSKAAVYVGIYFEQPPEKSPTKYVVFNNDTIKTSRYNYTFDKDNYLIIDSVVMVDSAGQSSTRTVPLLDSSTFYLAANLKYFLNVSVNHESVQSKLEAYKKGPIRTIVRVAFYYIFLKLKFKVDMYTELSLFSNSVILPAVISNPIDGTKILNSGSSFYYGFALHENPEKYQFSTNMLNVEQRSTSMFSFLERKSEEQNYWVSLVGEDRMMLVRLDLSKSMLDEGNIPRYYIDKRSAQSLSTRDNSEISPLGKSPVNLALSFDLTKFKKGEQEMYFQMFFENKKDKGLIEKFKYLNSWTYKARRI